MKPSGSLISYFSYKAHAAGGINLAQGIPGFDPPDNLIAILREAAETRKYLHQYPRGNGSRRLIDLLCDYFGRICPLNEDEVLIVQGATEGIALVFHYLQSLISDSASVLAFDPSYESYPNLSKIHKRQFIRFDYEQDLSVDFDKLESVIETADVKLILLNSPGNPLGKVWKEEEWIQINRLSGKFDCYIVYDNVYQDIYFYSPPFNPLMFRNPRLFYINSFSKMLSITGWRIGYVFAEREHMKAIRAMHDYTGLCAPSLFQWAIAEYLENNDFGAAYTSFLRHTCKKSYQFMAKYLKDLGFIVSEIEGGYFIWARLPEQENDAYRFAEDCFDKIRVAMVPGENFSETKRDYIRINFAMESKLLGEACKRLAGYIS